MNVTIADRWAVLLVHELVAAAWLPLPRDPLLVHVAHINGKRDENLVENLERVSATEFAERNRRWRVAHSHDQAALRPMYPSPSTVIRYLTRAEEEEHRVQWKAAHGLHCTASALVSSSSSSSSSPSSFSSSSSSPAVVVEEPGGVVRIEEEEGPHVPASKKASRKRPPAGDTNRKGQRPRTLLTEADGELMKQFQREEEDFLTQELLDFTRDS